MTNKIDTSPARLRELAINAIDFYGLEDMAAAFQAIAAEKEAQAGQEPPGWKLVPVKPTQEMVSRAFNDCGSIGIGSCGEAAAIESDDMRSIYVAMLEASPLYLAPQPSEQARVDVPLPEPDCIDHDDGQCAWSKANLHQYAEACAQAVLAAERERCAKLCERARPAGGRAWSSEQAACFDALTHVAQAIRAAQKGTT